MPKLENRDQVYQSLYTFVATEIMDGKAQDLSEHTPLLEWGLIDSFSLVKLTAHIRKSFGVELPPEDINPDAFKDLASITETVIARS